MALDATDSKAPSSVSPYGKGLAMQYGSALDLERSQRDQELGLARMKSDSQFRIESLRNSLERQTNLAREAARRSQMLIDRQLADTKFKYGMMSLQNQQRMQAQKYRDIYMQQQQNPDYRLQTMLLSGLMKDF